MQSKTCPNCFSDIPEMAKKCKYCQSVVIEKKWSRVKSFLISCLFPAAGFIYRKKWTKLLLWWAAIIVITLIGVIISPYVGVLFFFFTAFAANIASACGDVYN